MAAKKSRDQRKVRESQVCQRATLLEKENAVLRAQVGRGGRGSGPRSLTSLTFSGRNLERRGGVSEGSPAPEEDIEEAREK